MSEVEEHVRKRRDGTARHYLCGALDNLNPNELTSGIIIEELSLEHLKSERAFSSVPSCRVK